jgi:hypothetical protein
MIATNDFSEKFARALLRLTPKDKIVEPNVSNYVEGMTPDQFVRIQTELVNLDSEYKVAEESFADDVLTVTILVGYLRKLLGNERVSEYLERGYKEIHEEFTNLIKMEIT